MTVCKTQLDILKGIGKFSQFLQFKYPTYSNLVFTLVKIMLTRLKKFSQVNNIRNIYKAKFYTQVMLHFITFFFPKLKVDFFTVCLGGPKYMFATNCYSPIDCYCSTRADIFWQYHITNRTLLSQNTLIYCCEGMQSISWYACSHNQVFSMGRYCLALRMLFCFENTILGHWVSDSLGNLPH